MKALRFYDVQDLRYEDAPDPVIEKPDDVIVKVKAVGICGSDIARYRNLGPYVPGNVWGHEFCGEVVEVGEGVSKMSETGKEKTKKDRKRGGVKSWQVRQNFYRQSRN